MQNKLKKGRTSRSTRSSSTSKSRTHKCKHYSPECCEVSREAVNLGLAKDLVACTGNIPPDCKIRQDLEAGTTIMELFKK
ncbi:hypothetical protein ES707_10081 [subsurface metagenome]